MITSAILIGILIFVLIIFGLYASNDSGFGGGVTLGMIIAILVTIEIGLVSSIIEKSTPSALDVYRGNTELEVTSVNGTPIDTVVVFKKELKH